MYTDTQRPNHLAQEIIDNSVDEALAGYADTIHVVAYKDGSLSTVDNGRGMPVDIHAKHKMSGVELILTKLHSGGKFSNKNYQFSGGLHGVGVSVVNALSTKLEVDIKRDAKQFNVAFADGKLKSKLKQTGTVGQRNTGTAIRIWPDKQYFDSVKFSIRRLHHVLRAKAVLCPGLRITFLDEQSGDKEEWFYEDGLKDYILSATHGWPVLPELPFMGSCLLYTSDADDE